MRPLTTSALLESRSGPGPRIARGKLKLATADEYACRLSPSRIRTGTWRILRPSGRVPTGVTNGLRVAYQRKRSQHVPAQSWSSLPGCDTHVTG